MSESVSHLPAVYRLLTRTRGVWRRPERVLEAQRRQWTGLPAEAEEGAE